MKATRFVPWLNVGLVGLYIVLWMMTGYAWLYSALILLVTFNAWTGFRNAGRQRESQVYYSAMADPPVGVVLHLKDGRLIDGQPEYDGVSNNGFRWLIRAPVPLVDMNGFTVETVPPLTVIRIVGSNHHWWSCIGRTHIERPIG